MKRRNDRFGTKGVARLLLAFLCALAAGETLAVDLISNLIRCAPGMTPYVVLNGEERSSGKFYGYVNGGTGPGDSAFRDAKAWADAHNTPLVVVFDNGSGNTFTADLNDDEDYQGGRYLLQWMNSKAGPDNFNCMFTYFKGGTTAPAACKDAYDFCKQYGAGNLFPLVVCYWKWHDGTIKTSVTSSLSSVGSFEGPVNTFLSKNKPPPYTPPKSSVDFAVRDGELRMTPDATQVSVPMVRTNNTDAVGSQYGLEVTYPDATTSKISFKADTIGEIKLVEVATAGKWADGKSIQLVLFNTNQVAVATNHITCVATPANSVGFPYLPGKVDSLEVGEWSMDVGFISSSGTNVAGLRADAAEKKSSKEEAEDALDIAIAAYDAATNALASALSTSNTNYEAYLVASNALDGAISAYDGATNALAAALSTSNTTYGAYLVASNALDDAISAYDGATNALAAALSTSNTTYDAYLVASTALDDAISAYDGATNALASALSTSNTTYAAYLTADTVLSDAVSDYVDATNALDTALTTSNTTYAAYLAADTVLNEAISDYVDATNALDTALTTSNTTYAAYLAADTVLGGAISDYVDATNALATALTTSNTTYATYLAADTVLSGAISDYVDATNALASALTTSNTTYAAYLAAVDALDDAITDYVGATNALAVALFEHGMDSQEYTNALNGVLAATITKTTAESEYITASNAYEAAVGDIATKQDEVEAKTTAMNTAQGDRDDKYDSYTNAVAAVDAAQGEVDTKTTAMNTAQDDRDDKYDSYTNAVAAVDAALGEVDTKTTAMNTAQGDRDDKYDSYTNAVAAVDAALGEVDTKTTAMNTAQGDRDGKYDIYTNAVAAVDGALGEVEDKTTAMNTAQDDRDGKYDSYTNAVAAVDGAQGEVADKTTELNAAQGDRDGKYDSYTNAVAAVDAALGEVETKTAEMNAKQGECDDVTAVYERAANVLAAAEADFFVVFSGSVVANDEMGEAVAFFGSDEYREWALSNKVRNIILDCPEDAKTWKGASLFSYATAANGKSGAYFISINGLSAEEAERYSEGLQSVFMAHRHDWGTPGAPEVLLVRADGTEAGALSLYRDGSGYDVKENIARLDELVANAADLGESANDDPVGAAGLVTAGTRDACPYQDGVMASGVLSVNDTIDCFQLTGDGWAGKNVVFALATEGKVSDLARPGVAVLRYDAASGECTEVKGELSVFATNGVRDAEMVYAISQKDIDAGRIFAAVTAYDDEAAATTKFGGKSAFAYAVSAYEATPNAGIVTFDEQPDTAIIQATTNQVFNVPLYRLFGSDGDVSVNVVIDEALTTATGRYEFVATTLSWTNGETGVKYVPVTLKGSEYNDGLYDITLRIDEIEAMAGVEKYYTTYTISYGKEPSEEGQLAVVSLTPAARADGRIYVRYMADGELHADDTISVLVNRTGGKGPAAAYISWKNGKDTRRETLAWANYLTGTQTAFLDDGFPEPGKSGYADVTVTVTSSNSVPMVKDGSTLKVRVMPSDAPFFDDEAVTWSGVQYTTTATNLTALAVPAGMTVKSLAKISGTLPKGLKVAFVDGQLVVTGTPTEGTLSSTAVYWVTLARNEGGTLYSMPVTVTFENKALADVNDGFTSARSWTGLPLTGNGRLMGLLDLTVAKNGKTSARYRMSDGKTVAFSAPGLEGVDADGNVSLHAEKSVKSGSTAAEWEFSATLGADGSLEASVVCDGGNAVTASLPADAVSWSKKNTAERFGGNYVAAFPLADAANAHANTLCFGATSLRLKCDSESAWKSGKVTFAGTLPNGKAVSGTATLVPTTKGAARASLPIFTSSSSDAFSALVDLDGSKLSATEEFVPFWRHVEGKIESLSYENDLAVVGAAWSWANWRWTGEKVNVNRNSGVAAGTMRLDVTGTGRFSTISWKGVALPGGEPSILGAYWYSVSKPYIDGNGTERKRTVKAGGSIEKVAE